ncbi:hypothetical protein OE88DRAFT_1628741 [Heliocybe sulcata]|uniref:Uncharacterized protein n=1 Tax=Heliocybe sulcata TaxID=5364 RepID=A0A5C3N5M0_9AGAM|nr:hypothetical protein OE88DRAFT_1628741 [Heliocybe sulcata]
MVLDVGGLYIMLFARATPNDYHWALYHHTHPTKGTKWHIRNVSDVWMTDHNVIRDATKQFLLMGFLRIAVIPPERLEEADELIRSIPYNEPGNTCRTWVLDAIHTLREVGIVRCDDIDQLEAEAKAFGFSQFYDTSENKQPRPVVDSHVCIL